MERDIDGGCCTGRCAIKKDDVVGVAFYTKSTVDRANERRSAKRGTLVTEMHPLDVAAYNFPISAG